MRMLHALQKGVCTHELEAQILQSAEEGGRNSRHSSSFLVQLMLEANGYPRVGTGCFRQRRVNDLALERVEALKSKEEQERRDTKSRRTGIASVSKCLNSVLGKDRDKGAKWLLSQSPRRSPGGSSI
jgi:hypothetical protein